MELWSQFVQLSSSVREFVAPHYRPELHYMRGPGPAYARRLATLAATRPSPHIIDIANVR